MRRLRAMQRSKGFTLIELMIVIAIMGILAALVVTELITYRERAFVTSMQSDLQVLRTSEEAYHTQNMVYTANVNDLNGFGFIVFSTGNSAVITLNANGNYTVVMSSSKTSKTVTFDSDAGTTIVN